jgi:hypothetical protein
MGRIRTIKPEFFLDEELFDLEKQSRLPIRLAYAGLWTQVDREGRFEWRARTLKAAILPHDNANFEKILDSLEKSGKVERYSHDGREYGRIRSWKRHQVINNKERNSVLPPSESEANVPFALSTRDEREDDALSSRDKRVTQGKEGKGKEHGREQGKELQDSKTQDIPPPYPPPRRGVNDLSTEAQQEMRGTTRSARSSTL